MFKMFFRRFAWLSGMIFIVMFCNTGSIMATPFDDNTVVVTVGAVKITDKELEEAAKKTYSKGYADLTVEQRKKLIDGLVDNELLYSDAIKKGIEKNPEVIEKLERAKKDTLVKYIVEQEIDKKITVSKDEIKDYYDKNKESFKMPNQSIIDVFKVVVQNKDGAPTVEEVHETAEGIKVGISKGVTYDKILEKYKTGAFKDLIYFTPNVKIANGGLLPDVESVVFQHKEGDNFIIKQKTGALVIHMQKLIEGQPLPFDAQADVAISGKLKMKKYEEHLKQYIDNLKKGVNITINPNFLK